jgi:hypothetical protein
MTDYLRLENLHYLDLPSRGAARGAIRWVYDQGLVDAQFSCSFVYGENSEQIESALQAQKDRIGMAIDFEEERVHPDGFPFSRREVIVSVLMHGTGLPKEIIGAEIYPPNADATLGASELEELGLYMSLANTADLPEINERLAVLGLRHLISE